jgi:hypothetical protein
MSSPANVKPDVSSYFLSSAADTRDRLTGDPAQIAEATHVFNQAHVSFVSFLFLFPGGSH